MLNPKNSALVSLALVGLVDAISYMVVAPSLIFYVQQVGGSLEQYGFILSAFSFASFCAKPVLGMWTDTSGNKFRAPYLLSILSATIGGFLYFYASAFAGNNVTVAVGLILAGRILGGFGAANASLGFAYLASVIPPDEQTQVNSLLSMTRIIGMAAGPGFNVLLKDINARITIGSRTLVIDSLNAVGLFLVISNALGMIFIYFLLKEPGPRLKTGFSNISERSGGQCEGSRLDFIKKLFGMDILLPIFTIFVVNSNFQVIETGFAPAAFHALGWGPVQTSAVLGSTSIILFACMMLVFYLSSKKVKDETLVVVGSSMWCVGGLLVYFLWVSDAEAWHFVLSVFVCVCGFPFIGASNRSLFTRRVDADPCLETRHAFMQALLSMAASVAGFVTPGFVAKFVLRDPKEVDASDLHRELTPVGLYIVAGPVLVIVGVIYVSIFIPLQTLPEEDQALADETTQLVETPASRRSSAMAVKQKMSPYTEANRRLSAQIMGVPQIDTAGESKRRSSIFSMGEDLVDDAT